MENLRLAVGFVAVGFVALLGIAIIWLIYTRKIDLRYLLGNDATGDASMSRFQLLVFTFVIGLSFLYLVMTANADRLPDVPASVLTLLGISGTSFLVSKGIDAQQSDDGDKNPPPPNQ